MGECYLRTSERRRRRHHRLCRRGNESIVHDGQLCPYSNEFGDADEQYYHGSFTDDSTFMGVEELRLQTLRNWSPAAPVTARDLAKDGFFYLGPGDRVQCAFCRRVLYSWKPGDNVRAEHTKVNPRCPFVRGRASNVPPENISRLPTRVASQAGGLQQPAPPVSQARQAMQPSEEATSTRWQQPSDESPGAVGGSTYSYSTTSRSGSSSAGESNLPPKARMALLEGLSQPHLPPGASFMLGTRPASTAPGQPACTEPGAGTAGSQVSSEEPRQAWRSRGRFPEELSQDPSSFPGTRSAAARASSLEKSGSTGSRKASSSEQHAQLATFPGMGTGHVVSRQLASFPGPVLSSQISQTSSSSDESSLLDAQVDLFMSSPAVQAVKDMGLKTSDEELRALVLRLLLEQSRGFTASELAGVLMDMESNKLTVDQVSLPVGEASSKLSMPAPSQPAPKAKSSASSAALVAPPPTAASRSAPASLAWPARSLSSQSAGERDEALTCKVCMERQVQVTFDPCGHLVCCEVCSNQILDCPLCRHPINRRIRTYLT